MKMLFETYTDKRGRFIVPKKWRGWFTHAVEISENVPNKIKYTKTEKPSKYVLDEHCRFQVQGVEGKRIIVKGLAENLTITWK